MSVDVVAIRASARRIIEVANGTGNKARRHDLVVEAQAIIRLCEADQSPKRKTYDLR